MVNQILFTSYIFYLYNFYATLKGVIAQKFLPDILIYLVI